MRQIAIPKTGKTPLAVFELFRIDCDPRSIAVTAYQ